MDNGLWARPLPEIVTSSGHGIVTSSGNKRPKQKEAEKGPRPLP